MRLTLCSTQLCGGLIERTSGDCHSASVISDTADESRMVQLRQPMEIRDDIYPQFARSKGEREAYRGTVR